MEIRQLLQAHCLFILTRFISAESEVTLKEEKPIYALPGHDVNLTCTIWKEKEAHVTQTQWSKFVDTGLERLVVYNPLYGTTCFNSLKTACHGSASFKETVHCDQADSSRTARQAASNAECNQWILQLRNVSLEQAGVYECSFATFPAGIKSSEIHLIIKKDDETTSVVEILLNQTLEIPCFKERPSVNLENAPLMWLMKEDGAEEILITKQYYRQPSYTTNPTRYKERIQMDPENTLKISPVSIVDDGKKFICSVAEYPGRTMKSITEVKVFAKPEIAIYSSFTGKGNLTCVVRKAFPKPDLLWYVDGMILNDRSEGIFVENEDTMDADGFYELRSQLTRGSTTQPSIHQTFKCVCLYPFPGNEARNISSEKSVLPFARFLTTSSPSLKLISQGAPVSDLPPEQFLGTSSLSSPSFESISQVAPVSDSSTEKFQATSSPSLEFISQIAPVSTSPTERIQKIFSTSFEVITQVTPVSNSPTEEGWHSPKNLPDKASTTLSSYSSVPQSNPSTRRVTELITLTSHGNSPTVKGVVSGTTSPEHMKFSWPAVVSSMLLICTFLIVLGIRKWCHYRKEILNRPPSFKPPPPPIMYTPIHDTDGSYPSYNGLENL